ncbi:alpha/beta fold hydrolase [Planctomycetaceae bacterium SH139]
MLSKFSSRLLGCWQHQRCFGKVALRRFGVRQSTLPLASVVAVGIVVGLSWRPVVAEDPQLSGVIASEKKTYDVEVDRDVCFATVAGERLLCDIYRPVLAAPAGEVTGKASGAEPERLRPAAVVVHGGAWVSGDKWAIGGHARGLAEAGIVAISINYRHAPDFKFPAQVDDLRAALVWLSGVAEQYQIDPKRVGLMGYSAGAHLSCMLGTLVDAEWETVKLTTNWEQNDQRWQQMLKPLAIVAGGAPCDFTEVPLDSSAMAFFLGGSRGEFPHLYKAASPVTHASAGDIPTLMIHGTRDLIVPIASSQRLFQAHQRLGVASRFVALEGPGHMWTFIHPELKREAVAFLCDQLGLTK